MKLTPLGINCAWVAESPVWSDERGFFREWFKVEDVEAAAGRDTGIEQASVSLSSAGTLRCIQYSIAPRGQAKWITCASSSLQDVIVDIRPDLKTFGHGIDVELKGDSGKAVLVSEGLGHGFLALEENTSVAYLEATTFSPTYEFEINPLAEKIGIKWGIDLGSIRISDKDKNAPGLDAHLNDRKLAT